MPYATVTVIPTITKANCDALDVLSHSFEELPLPTRNGKPCKIENINIVNRGNLNAAISIIVVENIDGATTLGSAGSEVTISDADLATNRLLSAFNNITPTNLGTNLESTTSAFSEFVVEGKGGNPYYQVIAYQAQDYSATGANISNPITLTFSFHYEIPN